MKYTKSSAVLLLGAMLSFGTVNAQTEADSLGLPGDNFSLQGALELFSKVSSMEEFEKKLNEKDNKVNNLDLNNDGKVDYIKVIDKKDGDAHAIVLQVPVANSENQDVAVIELEKTGDKTAQVQIVGDEDLYGDKKIIEPQEPDAAAAFGNNDEVAGGPDAADISGSNYIFINVWGWPCVQFVYAPYYDPWVSPWDWYDMPYWYSPYQPMAWNTFYSYPRYYRVHYVYVNTHRNYRCQEIYRPYRATSVSVRSRNSVAINRYRTSRSSGYSNRDYNRSNSRVNDNRRYNGQNNDRSYRNRENATRENSNGQARIDRDRMNERLNSNRDNNNNENRDVRIDRDRTNERINSNRNERINSNRDNNNDNQNRVRIDRDRTNERVNSNRNFENGNRPEVRQRNIEQRENRIERRADRFPQQNRVESRSRSFENRPSRIDTRSNRIEQRRSSGQNGRPQR